MLQFASRIREIHPGIFVHSVYIDEDLDKDKRAGFVRKQLAIRKEANIHFSMEMQTNKLHS
jgi:hypothetical protein